MTAFITVCEDGTLAHAGLTPQNALAFAAHLNGLAADLIRLAQTPAAEPAKPAEVEHSANGAASSQPESVRGGRKR